MFLDEDSLALIGVLAGMLILSGWVQQIIRGYRTKSLKDVSRYLMSLIAAGSVLWLIYGTEVDDPYVVGTNLAAIVLMMVVIGMKQKYDKGAAPAAAASPK